jgi:hypothetical protein
LTLLMKLYRGVGLRDNLMEKIAAKLERGIERRRRRSVCPVTTR